MSPPPLGQLLATYGDVPPPEVERALFLQRRSGGKLGDILCAHGLLTRRLLARRLAEQQDIPLLDLTITPPHLDVCRVDDIDAYGSLGILPHHIEPDGHVLAATIHFPPAAEAEAFMRSRFPEGHRWAVTTAYDFRYALRTGFGAHMSDLARLTLWWRFPELSARYLLADRRGLHTGALAVIAMLVLASFIPVIALALLLAANVFYAASLTFKIVLFAFGRHAPPPVEIDLRDDQLPVYSVLVPLYRESAAVHGLLEGLRALDYPRDKLDVKLIVEVDDHETFAALAASGPEGMFEIIRVPPSEPRTKPKACNYALRFVRGEYLTIYDAEDRPAPDQLRKAVAAFRADPAVACLQGRLNYYNREETWLTRLFALEYALWFDHLLPGLDRLGLPMPLGGTSNHLHVPTLRALGEWDPFNVTEDADLGIRLAMQGHACRVLDSLTLEEAPLAARPWIKQRTRWIKGYLQTYLVHMRHPAELMRRLGVVRFMASSSSSARRA